MNQQVAMPQQQEELQTVTHKKVVVRTIQTRDGQVSSIKNELLVLACLISCVTSDPMHLTPSPTP